MNFATLLFLVLAPFADSVEYDIATTETGESVSVACFDSAEVCIDSLGHIEYFDLPAACVDNPHAPARCESPIATALLFPVVGDGEVLR